MFHIDKISDKSYKLANFDIGSSDVNRIIHNFMKFQQASTNYRLLLNEFEINQCLHDSFEMFSLKNG